MSTGPRQPLRIDLNADLGEDPEALAAGLDAALLDVVTSCNVACGGHAGDADSMRAVVRLARARGVAVGAHPSFPDRARFGRADLDLPAEILVAALTQQIAALRAVAAAEGVALTHVKAHGALYHAASRRPGVAEALVQAAAAAAPGLPLVAQAGSAALLAFRSRGLITWAEAFADRRYEDDGALRARTRPGALLDQPSEAAAQALRIARGLGALTDDGRVVPLAADTLCLHADTPGAATIARAVRAALEGAGFALRPPARR